MGVCGEFAACAGSAAVALPESVLVEAGVAGDRGVGERVGSFCFYSGGQRWEWSPAVARMHGYDPGEVIPTTELIMSHKHPDDAPSVAAVIEQVTRYGQPFSSRPRIIDNGGAVHVVVVVGDRLRDAAGVVIGTCGFYVDVTGSYERDVRGVSDAAVAEFTAHRAVIEQAKGMLMLVYGISAQRAYSRSAST